MSSKHVSSRRSSRSSGHSNKEATVAKLIRTVETVEEKINEEITTIITEEKKQCEEVNIVEPVTKTNGDVPMEPLVIESDDEKKDDYRTTNNGSPILECIPSENPSTDIKLLQEVSVVLERPEKDQEIQPESQDSCIVISDSESLEVSSQNGMNGDKLNGDQSTEEKSNGDDEVVDVETDTDGRISRESMSQVTNTSENDPQESVNLSVVNASLFVHYTNDNNTPSVEHGCTSAATSFVNDSKSSQITSPEFRDFTYIRNMKVASGRKSLFDIRQESLRNRLAEPRSCKRRIDDVDDEDQETAKRPRTLISYMNPINLFTSKAKSSTSSPSKEYSTFERNDSQEIDAAGEDKKADKWCAIQ